MSGTVQRLRQPEYTGENRCTPCTVVNVLIAVALSAGVAAGGAVAAGAAVGAGASLAFFAASLGAIYLRGYLVPGTPELTKRYFPPWLLAAFGKAPAEPATGVGASGDTPARDAGVGGESLDPEATLVGVGALEERPDGEDLRLTDAFRAAWTDAVEEARGADRAALLDALGVPSHAETEEFGSAFRLTVDGREAGRWESRAAFLADLASARVLADRYDGWAELSVPARGQLLNGLRLFVDSCPACEGTPEFGTETVESCCSTREVAAVSCPECGARLFEAPV